MKRVVLVVLWLVAIVAANLSSTHFGPSASVYNAFFLIGLSLTTRDALHTAWDGEGLKWKMASLIVTGSAISYLINQDALPIAVGSCVALAAAEGLDALVYHHLRDRDWYERVNGSNVPSAGVDSLLFPFVAFVWLASAPIPVSAAFAVAGAQFMAKVSGGLIWSFIIGKVRGASSGQQSLATT